ncbi:hypothetical protein Lbys_2449 [Leadbetterella byssophila DSM 17132]|uniref:Outer membrane protein beta-barrel domain-containing protein n=1 Tax=Leadbetterella byssophila (strain DSM 17132 / JCM 16389 / KACC 11308 / NBRC 106382 / 4M15) TaxID=649349 RepID=E4RXQ0_LEAB4|nr:outer membrane beta-barrel protein [Leadbetterella byssophila]ADQ18114.1 hypothetical protein Lbys_2449 [Leadbetterella byssophila DSM 17132]
MNEEWLREVRDALQDHQAPPPEGLWEEIDAKLFPKKKRRVFPLIFRWAATAVLVAGIINTFFPERPSPLRSEAKHELMPRPEAITSEDEILMRPVAQEKIRLEKLEYRKVNTPVKLDLPAVAMREVIPFMKDSVLKDESISNERKSRIKLSLFSSQSGSDYSQTIGGFARVSPLSAMKPEMDQVIEGNREQEVNTDIHHDMPLTLGMQVMVPLAKRWQLTSGISYTRMGTYYHSGSAGNAVSVRQEVHYVGLPLEVQYRFFPEQKVQLYASTGLILEKAVLGRERIRYVVENQLLSEHTERISERPLRFSATAALGVEAKIWPGVDLYLEPQLRYQIKSTSCISTVYDARPVQAGLRVGLRYTFR